MEFNRGSLYAEQQSTTVQRCRLYWLKSCCAPDIGTKCNTKQQEYTRTSFLHTKVRTNWVLSYNQQGDHGCVNSSIHSNIHIVCWFFVCWFFHIVCWNFMRAMKTGFFCRKKLRLFMTFSQHQTSGRFDSSLAWTARAGYNDSTLIHMLLRVRGSSSTAPGSLPSPLTRLPGSRPVCVGRLEQLFAHSVDLRPDSCRLLCFDLLILWLLSRFVLFFGPKSRTNGECFICICPVLFNVLCLQTFQSLSTSCESPDLPPDPVARPQHSFEAVTGCVSELRGHMEKLLNDTWPRISVTGTSVPLRI